MEHEFVENPTFEENISFGEIIRKLRRLMGMNQTDFGNYLGNYDQGTISRWENEGTTPPFEDGREILKRLGVDVLMRKRDDAEF